MFKTARAPESQAICTQRWSLAEAPQSYEAVVQGKPCGLDVQCPHVLEYLVPSWWCCFRRLEPLGSRALLEEMGHIKGWNEVFWPSPALYSLLTSGL